MDDVLKIGGLLVCLFFVSALTLVDWQLALTGESSQIIVEIPDSEPSEDPEVPPSLDLLVNVSSLDWGIIGFEKVNRSVLLTNSGNVGCQVYLRAENWIPENASQLLTLEWNQEGSVLFPGESLEAVLFLSVDFGSPAVESVSRFNFDIVITAVESNL